MTAKRRKSIAEEQAPSGAYFDGSENAERRRPEAATLRALVNQKRTVDNAIHAERLRLRR